MGREDHNDKTTYSQLNAVNILTARLKKRSKTGSFCKTLQNDVFIEIEESRLRFFTLQQKIVYTIAQKKRNRSTIKSKHKQL